MLKAILFDNGKVTPKAGIMFEGREDEFDTIIEYLKNSGFTYHEKWRSYSNIWVKKAIYSEYNIFALMEITEVDRTEELITFYENKLETTFYRAKFRPELLQSEPKGDYQIRGIKRGITQNRLYLAWQMGLGKTYAIVNILNHLFYYDKLDKVLIIAPSEGVYNFRREILKFASFSVTKKDFYIANVFHRKPFESDKKFIIMTYRTFLMLSDDAYKKKKGKKFKVTKKNKMYTKEMLDIDSWKGRKAIVLDEAHMIKNAKKARQVKALQLSKHHFEFRYLLSGTPFPNGIHELFSQIEFLDEGIIGMNYYEWLPTIANVGSNFSKYGINFFYPEKVKKFLEYIEPWFIRELAKDNLELPPINTKEVFIGLDGTQKEIYQKLITETFHAIKESKGYLYTREVRSRFPYIMQALSDPCLLKGKIDKYASPELFQLVNKWKFEDNPKEEITTSLLEKYIKEEGKKVIIWSGHPKTIEALKKKYNKYNPVVIHGEMNIPKDKDKDEHKNNLLDKFRDRDDCPLLIASFLMVKTSIDLVECNKVIYWDRSYDLIDYSQTVGRVHRIGQEESVLIHNLIIEDSFEIFQNEAIKRKDIMDTNFHRHEMLSKEAWRQIFEGEIPKELLTLGEENEKN